MYFNDFVSANKFTQSIGLSGATIKPSTSVRHLNDPTFFTKLGPYLKIDDPQELVAQCNVVSQVVCEAIKQAIGCNAYLTIGDVSSYGKPYFNMDKAYVTDLISGGKQSLYPQKYHHHAWITLDSMEIIDFTISTSLAMISPGLSNKTRLDMIGGVLSGHGDELTHGAQYHPVLVGEEFYNEYDAAYPLLKERYLALIEGKPGQQTTIIKPASRP
jgi:hypothetical protein